MPFRNPFNILRICAEVDQKKEKEKKKEGGKGDKQDSSANKNSYYASGWRKF